MAAALGVGGRALNDGEIAWRNYQEIERVTVEKYSAGKYFHEYLTAMQRLRLVIFHSHGLDPVAHQPKVKSEWNITLQKNAIPRLVTIEQMLTAKIIVWEDEIPSEQVGHDSYTEGRRAGYRPQLCLEEVLGTSFYTLKVSFDNINELPLDRFTRIQTIVQREIERLHQFSSQAKARQLEGAMARLKQAVIYKYHLPLEEDQQVLSKTQKQAVDAADLDGIGAMLDLRVGDRSVRQALNLSINNLIGQIFGLHEAWWGKTGVLIRVEERLGFKP